MAGSHDSREQSGEGAAPLLGVLQLRQPFGGQATLCGQGHSGRSRGAGPLRVPGSPVWLILWVHLPRPGHTDIWSSTSLDVAGKVMFSCD